MARTSRSPTAAAAPGAARVCAGHGARGGLAGGPRRGAGLRELAGLAGMRAAGLRVALRLLGRRRRAACGG